MPDSKVQLNTKRLGGILLIIGFITALILLSLLFHLAFYKPKKPYFETTKDHTKIYLYRDNDNHFRIAGMINNVPVTFLIDTGATNIAIPEHIAQQANLKSEQTIYAHTANGIATGYMTRIPHCTIGPIIFENIKAIIIPTMQQDEALLGMNILKKLNFQQKEDLLIINIPNNSFTK